jgi:soluble lytic murein transglycosylase-like protein
MRSVPLRKPRPWRAAALALALLAAAPAHADVYGFVDEDGTPRFTNIPDDPRYALLIRDPQAAPGGAGGAPTHPRLEQRPFHGEVRAAAHRFRLDPALIHAVIEAESKYNPNAVSNKGAIGLMQVMPETARRYGVGAKELRVPAKNIAAGAQYLADLLRLFEGNVELALAGYNAGEHAVARYGQTIPPFAETKAYVPRVIDLWKTLGGRPPVSPSAPRRAGSSL